MKRKRKEDEEMWEIEEYLYLIGSSVIFSLTLRK